MQRDMDLVREILFALEAHSSSVIEGEPDIRDRTADEVSYHVRLMVEAGLVWSEFYELEQTMMGDAEGRKQLGVHKGRRQSKDQYRLTWAGHEFLDAARAHSIWNNVKQRVKDEGVGMTVDLLKALLKHEISQRFGLPGF